MEDLETEKKNKKSGEGVRSGKGIGTLQGQVLRGKRGHAVIQGEKDCLGRCVSCRICMMRRIYLHRHYRGCQIRACAANHRRDLVLDGILDETWK